MQPTKSRQALALDTKKPMADTQSITPGRRFASGFADEAQPVSKRRKRGRHASACISCHRRKQKCDGTKPCLNCTRRDVASTCTFPETDTAEDAPRAAPAERLGAAATDGTKEHTPHTQQRNSEAEEDNDDDTEGPRSRGDPRVGSLFRSRDAPSFFGSSYFGPQAAAKVIEAPAPESVAGMSQHMPAGSLHSFRDVGGPFSQIWDLLGLLPRRKSTADRLTECFLEELNWAIDAVHPTAFRSQYQAFWARKFGFDDLASIDLRWLALLFIVLAYGVLLDCPQPLNVDMQRELEETSLRFYWAARRAIVIAPTFYGESTDLVRAGVLVTRYLIYSRRVPESWLTTSFAMRMAQAQGMHIDGERWRLSRKDTETRRRLWSNLYLLDKTIALSLGRPFAIVDQQCLVEKASNVWLDNMDDDAAASAPVLPISEPTPGVSNRLCHELAIIVGAIQEKCFGLFTVSYDTVLTLDREILEWRKRLPAYFRLEDPDLSLDSRLPFLAWNRLHIHSMYHFARVTLHRPYLLRPSITNRFRLSHDACISSACADLSMRLQSLSQPLQDRLRWTLGPHYLFNSALVLGIIAVRDPASRRSLAILEDLAAYCEMQRKDIWVNEFSLAEVKIVELCIKKARELRSASDTAISNVSSAARLIPDMHTPSSLDDTHLAMSDGPAAFDQANSLDFTGFNGSASWQPLPWDDSFTFPEAADLQSWEQVIDSITQNKTRVF